MEPNAYADRVRPIVCAHGGDAIATELDGMGVIVRGVVFHKKEGLLGS